VLLPPTFKIEADCFSEMLKPTYQSTKYHIPVESCHFKSNNAVNHVITNFYDFYFKSWYPWCSFSRSFDFLSPLNLYILIKEGRYFYYVIRPFHKYVNICSLKSHTHRICCLAVVFLKETTPANFIQYLQWFGNYDLYTSHSKMVQIML
jgi:hypothetical protein